MNIYAPNDANQQVTFFKELENELEDFAQENIIITGDFNCALSENDKKGGNPNMLNKYADLDDLGLKWDLIKMEIRGFTISYSNIKAKNKRNEEAALQNKVNELMQKCEQNPTDKRILNELYATKLRLQTIMRQKTKGAILRSKARWHEFGERNSKYFFNLEKRNHFKKQSQGSIFVTIR